MTGLRILVCVKRVPAPGARINVTADGRAVETAHLGFTTSPHEECAVEEAVRLVEAGGGSVTVLTLGPPEAEEQLRYAASVGADELVLVPTEGADDDLAAWDPQRTAAALTKAIDELEQTAGRFDLLLFGNESADAGGFQVGVRVATGLGRPIVNGIKGIEIEGDNVVARRAVDDGFEVYRLPLPAVLGVKEGINLPRYPTMKGRLASKKVGLATIEVEADPGGQVMVGLKRPEETVSNTEILVTDGSEATVDADQAQLIEQVDHG
ncbi:MAG: electron transfer flavoprotein subunit beta/FixA family protein, partial [Actinomycetota bacterium]